ncbi:MAG TPA: hypothetical protein VM901_06070 [Bdellovibrionota bacterium]|jgi:hypothetical protein|nr:hypothetical protein [Bdellovibrionota bacterium]
MNSLRFTLASLGLVALSASATSPMPTAAQRLAGTYTQHTIVVSPSEDGMNFAEDKSTLKITTLTPGSAKIELEQVEGNGSGCSIDAVAKTEKDVLTIVDESLKDDVGVCRLQIIESDSKLSFSDDEKGICNKLYCGHRAGLGAEFAKNSHVNVDGKAVTTLLPLAKGKSLCFNRSYSTKHMNEKKKQLLSGLTVKITTGDNDTQYVRVTASDRDIDSEDAKSYAAFGACTKLTAEEGSCGIDEDGGQFVLKNKKDGSIELVVKTHLALTQVDEEQKALKGGKNLNLDGEDTENNVYKLYAGVCYSEP